MHVSEVRTDLLAEQQALDDLVASLTDDQWSAPTPSPRWTVADQVGHLAYFDRTAAVAITDPERFEQLAAEMWEESAKSETAGDDLTLGQYRAMTSGELLEAWRRDRAALADAASMLEDDTRVIWYGPSMGSKSFLTARLMEVWAHGQDIADTVGVERPAEDRIRHIAQLGFITRGWSYVNRGLDAPDAPVRVELTSPSGQTWTYGPVDATETITGPAVDFCLVVTQRRHVDDTSLSTTPIARDWMEKAQAFAGPPTEGPAPSQ